MDKATGALAVNWDDELVRATCLTRDGAVVHAGFAAPTMPPTTLPPVPEPGAA